MVDYVLRSQEGRTLSVKPGDLYVISNGFVCHINTFFADHYIPFAGHDGFETAFDAPFMVVATKCLVGENVYTSPTVLLLLRLKDSVLCSTYVWDGDTGEEIYRFESSP